MFNEAVQIKKEVCSKRGIRFSDLEGPIRTKTISRARIEAIGRIRAETTLSYSEIGSLFGRRDHSTIIYAVKIFKKNPEIFN